MAKHSYKCGTKIKAAFTKHREGELPTCIRYWHSTRFRLPGLSISETRDCVKAAFTVAGHYVPIEFKRVERSADALIQLKIGPEEYFDGQQGTLAMADVKSLYDPTPREIWFDPGDSYLLQSATEYEMGIYALPVLLHEIGHTLGFGHGKAGSGLMSPYYDPHVIAPTKQEMARFFDEYRDLAKH